MFGHTMTIYRHEIVNSADVYTKQVVHGVSWLESEGVSTSGSGFINSNDVEVWTSKALTDSFGKTWDIKPKDWIVKGTGGNISSFKDIPHGFVVTKVKLYQCGSRVDNIEIRGV